MDIKPKIALLFSGKLGQWTESSQSILENIVWPLRPDVYVTTWDDQPSYDFCSFYNPVNKLILNFKETMDYLGPTDKLACEPNAGLIPMLAGLKILNTMLHESSKQYDLVIRLRPDVQVLEQIKPDELKDCLNNQHIRLPFFESVNIYNHEEELKKPFNFSFIYEKASLPDQVNDQIAIGHPDQMNKYMNSLFSVATVIQQMWDEGYPEYMMKVPESVLTMCLKNQQCKYKRLSGTSQQGNIKTKLIK
jgi:hypothetical protein